MTGQPVVYEQETQLFKGSAENFGNSVEWRYAEDIKLSNQEIQRELNVKGYGE
jgi:hypothetical protein